MTGGRAVPGALGLAARDRGQALPAREEDVAANGAAGGEFYPGAPLPFGLAEIHAAIPKHSLVPRAAPPVSARWGALLPLCPRRSTGAPNPVLLLLLQVRANPKPSTIPCGRARIIAARARACNCTLYACLLLS